MRLSRIITVRNHLKRITGIPWRRRAFFIINTAMGELVRKRTFGTLGLRLVDISLTRRCQCRCVHCYATPSDTFSETNEISTSEVYTILDQVKELRATEVCFTGGEPLLRQDIVDLVSYARKIHLIPRISTNGILLSESLVNELKKAGLAWCAVSIDSAQAELHDALRFYEGCYQKAINGINLLVAHRIPTSIVTYVRKSQTYIQDLVEIVALGQELNVDIVRINFPVPLGRLKNHQNVVLTFEEREEVRKLLRNPIVTMESPREGTKCTAAVTKIHIDSNGDVTPCVLVPIPYGNIRKNHISEIWRNMAEFTKMYKPKGQCPMCDPFFCRNQQKSQKKVD